MRVGAGQLVASAGLMATSKLAAGLVQVTATEVAPTLALATVGRVQVSEPYTTMLSSRMPRPKPEWAIKAT